MNDSGKGSILGRVAYSIGYALGRADSIVESGASTLSTLSNLGAGRHSEEGEGERPESVRGAGRSHASPTAGEASFDDVDELDDLDGLPAGLALGTFAVGWVLSRVLRPHPINWPRAIAAGVAATALADLVGSIEPDPEGEVTHFPPGAEDLPRYAAGIATAAAYAAQIYPRLPGSPLTRGLIFGTAEASLAGSGGALGLIQRYAPQLRLPLGSLASQTSPSRGALASLAFGIGLALYAEKDGKRAKGDQDEESRK